MTKFDVGQILLKALQRKLYTGGRTSKIFVINMAIIYCLQASESYLAYDISVLLPP